MDDLRKSGLLEFYVLGDISEPDRLLVDNAIASEPTLIDDLKEIQYVLEVFAFLYAVEPQKKKSKLRLHIQMLMHGKSIRELCFCVFI